MKIDYEEIYDLISLMRLRLAEEDLTQEDVLDELEKEISNREAEEYE